MKHLLLVLFFIPLASISQEVPPPPSPKVYVVPTKKVPIPVVIDFPDVEAQFPGGNEALQTFIKENLRYPEVSKVSGKQGRVYITFIVGKDGAISQVKVVKGVSTELDQEAKRVVRSFPNWIPAEVGGKKVISRCRIPIVFVLPE